jgi:hypothetical protein
MIMQYISTDKCSRGAGQSGVVSDSIGILKRWSSAVLEYWNSGYCLLTPECRMLSAGF